MSILTIFKQSAGKDSLLPITGTKPVRELYAATNLEYREIDLQDTAAGKGETLAGSFRRLDPEYYAWLRHRMTLAQKAKYAGRIDSAAYEVLRERFNGIHRWALARFGENRLLVAVNTLDPSVAYQPAASIPAREESPAEEKTAVAPEEEPQPEKPFLFPAEGHWPFTAKIAKSAVSQVDAIREEALSLGWTEARLYQNRGRLCFPFGHDWGLVCFLQEGDRITQVNRQRIELILPPPRESRLHFSNPDVDQPWQRRISA